MNPWIKCHGSPAGFQKRRYPIMGRLQISFREITILKGLSDCGFLKETREKAAFHLKRPFQGEDVHKRAIPL